MDRTTIEDALFPDCPIRNILARLCDKWSLLVIYTLNRVGGGPIRFKELQREIPDISQKMLTVTLRRGRICNPYRIPRSSTTGWICVDAMHTLPASPYRCADRLGQRKHGNDYEQPEACRQGVKSQEPSTCSGESIQSSKLQLDNFHIFYIHLEKGIAINLKTIFIRLLSL